MRRTQRRLSGIHLEEGGVSIAGRNETAPSRLIPSKQTEFLWPATAIRKSTVTFLGAATARPHQKAARVAPVAHRATADDVVSETHPPTPRWPTWKAAETR